MADNLDEVFSDVEQELPADPPAAVPDVAPEPVAEAEAPEQEAPESVEPQQQDGRFVPLAAVLDERDKRKALEARIAEFERNQRVQPQETPDPFDSPTEFRESVKAEIRLEMSDRFARQKYGDEDTQKAINWAMERAQSDPAIAISFARQADPVGWLVQQHQRDTLVSQIGDKSMDDFVRDYLAKNPNLVAPAPVAATVPVATPQQASPPVKVPRSLASQGSGASDIRHVATGPLAAVDAVFT